MHNSYSVVLPKVTPTLTAWGGIVPLTNLFAHTNPLRDQPPMELAISKHMSTFKDYSHLLKIQLRKYANE